MCKLASQICCSGCCSLFQSLSVQFFNLQIPHDLICQHSLFTVAYRCSSEQVFLEVLQSSWENTCARVFLNRFTDLRSYFPVNFAKMLKKIFQSTSGGCFCATLPNMNNSKVFVIDFHYWFRNSCYVEQCFFRVTLSIQVIYQISYFLKQLFF